MLKCPTCNAETGTPCITKSGTKASKPHALRKDIEIKELCVVDNRTQYQKAVEERLSRRSLSKRVQDSITTAFPDEVQEAIDAANEWLVVEDYWIGKRERLNVLIQNKVDFSRLIPSILSTAIASTQEHPMKLVTLASMVCGQIPLDDKGQQLQTAAELIGVICNATDLLEAFRTKDSTVMIQPCIDLDEELLNCLKYRFYLPPMLVKPNKLRANTDSGYLTQSSSLILGGAYNHHERNISLDVLNTLNGNVYEIDSDFVKQFKEEWHKSDLSYEEFKELSKAEKDLHRMDEETWNEYREQCDAIYDQLIKHGNKFHFTHKVDKRGRVYSQGYHLNPQGKAYKKAMLNLAHKEICTGIEEWANA